MLNRNDFETGQQVRAACRSGKFSEQTSGLAPGYAQANLVILPQEFAYDFLLFCQRNPKPCPLLEVTDAGSSVPQMMAPSADLRTDLPRYCVWKDGELADEPSDIRAAWQDDFVSFLLGCSFTFDAALVDARLPVRHIELGTNVPMFRTNVACASAGRFSGSLVVSMRPMKPDDAVRAVQVTSRYPGVHGAPVHLGNPSEIGIADLSHPDYGEAVPIGDDEISVFWACGVTPQPVLQQAKLPVAITHSPGCMFVTDVLNETLAVG